MKIRELKENFRSSGPELNAITKQYVYSNLEKKFKIKISTIEASKIISEKKNNIIYSKKNKKLIFYEI